MEHINTLKLMGIHDDDVGRYLDNSNLFVGKNKESDLVLNMYKLPNNDYVFIAQERWNM